MLEKNIYICLIFLNWFDKKYVSVLVSTIADEKCLQIGSAAFRTACKKQKIFNMQKWVNKNFLSSAYVLYVWLSLYAVCLGFLSFYIYLIIHFIILPLTLIIIIIIDLKTQGGISKWQNKTFSRESNASLHTHW